MKTNKFSSLKLLVSFAALTFGLLFLATPKVVAQCNQYNLDDNSSSDMCAGELFDAWLDGSEINVWYTVQKSINYGNWIDVMAVQGIDPYGVTFTSIPVDSGYCHYRVVVCTNVVMNNEIYITGHKSKSGTLSNYDVGSCEGVPGSLKVNNTDPGVMYYLTGPYVTADPQMGGGELTFTQDSWHSGNYYVYGVDQIYGCISPWSNAIAPVSYNLGTPVDGLPQGSGDRTLKLEWTNNNTDYNDNCGNEHFWVELYERTWGGGWYWNQIVNQDVEDNTDYTHPSQLPSYTDYCWRVIGFNQDYSPTYGLAESELWYFTTGANRMPAINNYGEINAQGLLTINNNPNPFGDATIIYYSIPEENIVEVCVYSLQGEKLTQLVSERQKPGNYSINFSSNNLSGGIYSLVIKNGMSVATSKLVVVK